jgi:hypothetical protein
MIENGAVLYLKTHDGLTIFETIKSYDPEFIENNPELFTSYTQNENIQKRKRVNITKTVNFFDPIMQEEEDILISDYLEENKDNIVFVYDNNKYFLTNREIIDKQEDDAVVYPCKETSMALIPRRENVKENEPLFDLKKIGFMGGYFCDMTIYNNNPDLQTFTLVNTNKSYPSFVSKRIFSEGGDVVSGLHCQEGQGSKISKLLSAYPSVKDNPEESSSSNQSGGKTRKNKRKNRTIRRRVKILNKKSRKSKHLKKHMKKNKSLKKRRNNKKK